MMRLIRRRIRNYFAIQAILSVAILAGVVLHPRSAAVPNPLRLFVALTGLLLFAMLFASAYWTTRKPSPYRNLIAVAASALSCAEGVGLLYWLGSRGASLGTMVVMTLAGAAGVYIYSQGGPMPAPGTVKPIGQLPVVKAARPAAVKVAGDRTSQAGKWAVTAVSWAAQFAAVRMWSVWAHAHHLYRGTILPWYAVVTVAAIISTALHEGGHALAGRHFRMKLLSFNAGPFQWRKYEGKWKFKFDTDGLFDLGGSVHVVPTNIHQPPAHDAWVSAAGPIANVIVGVIAMLAVMFLRWPLYTQTWTIVAYVASFSFIAAIANMIPFMTKDGGYSDGAHILQALTKSPMHDYIRTQKSLSAMLVTDRRYRDLNVAALERSVAMHSRNQVGVRMKLVLAQHHWDAGRLDDARTATEQAERMYSDYKVELTMLLHGAFVVNHALLFHNPRAARTWWERLEAKPEAKRPENQNVDYWLARTAVLWIESRKDEAEAAWLKASTEATKLPPFGAYEFDRLRCAMLRDELDKGVPAAVPISKIRRSFVSSGVRTVAAVEAVTASRWDPVQIIRDAVALEPVRGRAV